VPVENRVGDNEALNWNTVRRAEWGRG